MSNNFHVSPSGHDSQPGTKAKPFATIERARQAVATLDDRPGATVWIEEGVYELTAPLDFDAGDSGTPAAPVTYRAADGARPRIIGGKRVSAWSPVSDADVRNRLDATARDHVRQADLGAIGITDIGAMASRGFSRPSTPSHLELFYNDQPMTLAQWPNNDWATIDGYPDSGAMQDGHGADMGEIEQGFILNSDRPRRWRDLSDVWVHGYWAHDWANSYEQVESIDADTGLVKTRPPHGLYGMRKGQRICFVNILEELDAPGEYFVDRASGTLCFYPPEGDTELDQAVCMVSVLAEPMIRMRGAGHIHFAGLALECCRGEGLHLEACHDVVFANGRIVNTGNYGAIVRGGESCRVVRCEICNNGDGGVHIIGGDRKTLTPGHHAVTHCHLHHQARWSRCYQPSILMHGVGLRAAHNLIHDHPHCPILFGGNEMLIELNEIHHVCWETGDVGAIYVGRDYTMRGNVIRHNFLHHIQGPGMFGSQAVYLDDCASGTHVVGNVFFKTQLAAFIGGGRDTLIENNIFVDCHPAVQVDGRGIDERAIWRNMVVKTMFERCVEVDYLKPPYITRYPQLASLKPWFDKGAGVPPEGNIVRRNICVGGEWLKVHWNAKPEWVEVADNFEGDPLFVDADAMDFRLRPESPAWAIGFEPIPLERIGPQCWA